MNTRSATVASTAPDYRHTADEAIHRLCGVSYTTLVQICPGLDLDEASVRRCEQERLPALAFAEAFRRAHGFHSAQETGPEVAREFNERRAALIEFASTTRWTLNGAGPATMETASGTLQLDVVSKDGRLGFGVASEGSDPYVRMDIGDAVRGAMLKLRQDVGLVVEVEPSSMRMS